MLTDSQVRSAKQGIRTRRLADNPSHFGMGRRSPGPNHSKQISITSGFSHREGWKARDGAFGEHVVHCQALCVTRTVNVVAATCAFRLRV